MSANQDFAILHVDKTIDYPLKLAPLKPDQKQIYSFASDQSRTNPPSIVSGIIAERTPKPQKVGRVIYMDAPIWAGDSGGGVLAPDGTLVGVNTGYKVPWMSFRFYRTAYLPDLGFVRAVIAKDRTDLD